MTWFKDLFIDEAKSALSRPSAGSESGGSGGGISVTGATVGQTVKIAEVDENGVPTVWESADFPSGGGGAEKVWRKLKTIAFTEDVGSITIDEDDNGNPFAVSELKIDIHNLKGSIGAALGLDVYCGSSKITFVSTYGTIFQSGKDNAYLHLHLYHDGVGYRTLLANNTSNGVDQSNILTYPVVISESVKQDITKVSMKSGHSGSPFKAGATIDIWGVDV